MRLFNVEEIKSIGQDTVSVTIMPQRKRDAFLFYPGQYAAIGFKRNGRPSQMRCFSIVSSPEHPDTIQFAMRVQGDFTRAISELNRGDVIFLHGPFGDFVIDKKYDKNIVMLAGGIGITPFMSMIRAAAETCSALPITLLYSYSSPEHIPFRDELLELEKRNPHFKVIFFISQGSIDQTPKIRQVAGRIDGPRLQQYVGGRYSNATYFICGPKQFIKSLSDALQSNDVTQDRIVIEEFTSSSKTDFTAPKLSVTRWAYGLTGATLILAAGFFMSLDLARVVPRALQTQALAASSQPTRQAPANLSGTDGAAPAANITDSTGSNVSSPAQPPVPSYSQTYRQPVTAVS